MVDGAVMDAGLDGDPGDGGPDAMVPPPEALLVFHALDVWGQPLVAAETTLSVRADGAEVTPALENWPAVTFPLNGAEDYVVRLESAAYHPMEFVVSFDGTSNGDAVQMTIGDEATYGGTLVAHGELEAGTWPALPAHQIMVGLRHRFFSSQGAPARRGNDITLYTNGQDAWEAVNTAIRGATDSVHMASWWWRSNFELVRPDNHAMLTAGERQQNTVLAALESTAATKRILIGHFLSQDGVLSDVSTDDALRAYGPMADDDFEYMGQANETSGRFDFAVEPFSFGDRIMAGDVVSLDGFTLDAESLVESNVPGHMVDLQDWPLGITLEIRAASYHQKFYTIDDQVAFIGGMNLQEVDWDTDEHRVFDERRMDFDASFSDRMAVQLSEEMPDRGPRKDYMTRIEGPIVEDASEVFLSRWSYLVDTDAEYAENATVFDTATVAPVAGGVQAQVTVTMPDPYWDHSIAESWFNAVRQAEDYIFIEDQYWRIPMLVDAIIARMEEVPTLQLVVFVRPVNEFTDPGCEWTYITNERLASRFPDRYTLLQQQAFDATRNDFGIDETRGHFVRMDIHAKMLIVDDVFMSIGSANKNNRGAVYEGEMNVAVYDAAWVRAQRMRILELILPPGMDAMVDSEGWIEQLTNAASWNDFVRENWDDEGDDLNLNGDPLPDRYIPQGFVYSLSFPSSDECLIEGVGPDMM